MEIKTTNKENVVINCINNIINAVNYIVEFKPHKIQSPFMNNIECTNIGGYSSVLDDLKNNILKELLKEIFNEYKKHEKYIMLINKVELIR